MPASLTEQLSTELATNEKAIYDLNTAVKAAKTAKKPSPLAKEHLPMLQIVSKLSTDPVAVTLAGRMIGKLTGWATRKV